MTFFRLVVLAIAIAVLTVCCIDGTDSCVDRMLLRYLFIFSNE
jgi:outer membrane biogenesis lipoprotein LolB